MERIHRDSRYTARHGAGANIADVESLQQIGIESRRLFILSIQGNTGENETEAEREQRFHGNEINRV
jgi:hypothetical protein